jgi:Middle or third domain of peptidase_M16
VSGSELIFSIDTQASWDLLKFFTPENSFVVVKHKGLINAMYILLLYIYYLYHFIAKQPPALNLSELLTVIINSGFTGKTTLKEKWYGTEYNEFPLAKDTQIDRWRKCLQGESEWADLVFLPLQNPFVPTDFTIKTNGLSAAAAADISISAAAQTEGASEAAISPVEARTMPDLIDYVTTVSDDANDTAEEESVTPPTGDIPSSTPADAADTTEAAVDQAPAPETAEASKNAEEEEEEEEEESEEGPAGQLPPPQGKV